MFERLSAICIAPTENLAELAKIAAPNDPAFFDGADFRDADLRDTDLSRFSLREVDFAAAQVDETTQFPESASLDELLRQNMKLREVQELQNAAILTIKDGIIRHLSSALNKKNRKSFYIRSDIYSSNDYSRDDYHSSAELIYLRLSSLLTGFQALMRVLDHTISLPVINHAIHMLLELQTEMSVISKIDINDLSPPASKKKKAERDYSNTIISMNLNNLDIYNQVVKYYYVWKYSFDDIVNKKYKNMRKSIDVSKNLRIDFVDNFLHIYTFILVLIILKIDSILPFNNSNPVFTELRGAFRDYDSLLNQIIATPPFRATT